jgi:TP901 family phage tail tape measure protein
MDRGTRKARGFADTIALKGVNLGAYTAASLAVIKLTESISVATRDALRFEVEMAKVAQTVGISTEEAKKHGDEIRKLSVLYGLSAPKIAETVKVLGQAGYTLRQAKEAADSLAQTTLLASFESISDTTDGLIAVNKQFIDTVGKSAEVLSVFNVVSKKYAVESADLVEVVRKAGGTFSATGGSLEELLAVFTTVRDTTRESAETIAVGLRTIFSRLQRPKTIEYLKQFGIELVNLEGQFVGNFEAIQRIQRGLDAFNVRPGSVQFAEVVEKIGGVLQQSRVIPLLTQGAKLQQVYSDAQSATSETASDLAKAQDTLSFKIAQTQQNFAKMIGEIAGSDGFDTLVRGVLSMTNAMIHFGTAIKDVLPLVSALLALNLAKSVGRLSLGGLGAIGGRRFASGGFVPGSGNGDTVPAMLTPGEFVIRKSAAQAMGPEALHRINKYANGGPVLGSTLGSSAIRSRVVSQKSRDEEFKAGQKINAEDSLSFDKIQIGIDGGKRNPKAFEKYAADYLKKNKGFAGIKLSGGLNDPIDLVGGPYPIEVRSRKELTPDNKLLDKFLRWRLDTQGRLVENTSKAGESLTIPGKVGIVYNTGKLSDETLKNSGVRNLSKKPIEKAFGGGISGTDTVPALLTPGEFVVNKKSAQAFGYGNLHKVNKYASGGVVGAQRFASGGVVGANSLLPGLEGLGDLAIVVNQLIPALGNATSSFAAISVQGGLLKGTFSGIRSVASGVSDFVTAYRAENKRLLDAQEEATNNVTLITGELRAAKVALASEVSAISSPAKSAKVTSEATAIAKSSVSGQSSQKITRVEKREALSDIRTELSNIALTFRSSGGTASPEYLAARKLIQDLNKKTGNVIADMSKLDLKSTAEALKKYTAAVKTGAPAQTEVVEALKIQARAARKAASEATRTNSIVSSLKRGASSVASSPQGRELLSTAATAGVAALAARASGAADAAQKLSVAAVASGNSQEAYTNSLNASAEQQKATAIEQGASVGAAIGSLFGPMGTAIGTVIGGFLGLTGVITAFTDFLGFTNSEADAKIKAQEQERSAALVKADKISSTALTKSSDIRKFDPKAADTILFKGVRDLIDQNDAEGSIANKDIQEQAKALFTAASSSIEELSHKTENAGKSFAQLSAENHDLFVAWQESGEIIEGNNAVMQAQVAQHNAVAAVVNKEKQVRQAAINMQLRQLAIQERVNQSLLRMDKVTNAQNALMSQLDVALGGGLSSKEIGSDLSNMDSRNTNSDAYKRGLDAVAAMGPEFAEKTLAISKALPAFRGIGTRVTQMQDAGNGPEQIKEELLDIFKQQGLSTGMIDGLSSLFDTMKDDIDASTIEAAMIDATVKPLADGLEPARKAINQQLDDQLSILKKLSELDQNRLAIALSGFEASLKTSRAMDKILGVDADPMAERGARVLKGGINLQGTSLQGMPLTGEKGDISKIANLIKQNELKKLDIERQIGEAGPDTKFGLQKEFTDLASETDKLKAAMSALSDVSEENAALEEKLAKSRANREAVRGAATDLAFGTNSDRGKFFKTLNQARGVAFTGSAEIVNPEDRGAVKSFLTTFKNLPAFAGGQTGQEVLDSTTKNYLVNQLGVPLEQVDLVMKDFTRSEMDAVDLIRENLTIDEKRNDLLGDILAAISQNVMFNAPNAALPNRPAGPFLGIGGVNHMSVGGMAPNDPSSIFKPKGTDTIPAMLTPGEYVVSAKYAQKNKGLLQAINSGKTEYLSGGSKDSNAWSRIKSEDLDIGSIGKNRVAENNVAKEISKGFKYRNGSIYDPSLKAKPRAIQPQEQAYSVQPYVPPVIAEPKGPKSISELQQERSTIGSGPRGDAKRARLDKRIGVLKDRAAEKRDNREANELKNKLNPQAPTLPPNVQAQVMSDFGPASGSIPSVPSIPNSGQKPRQGPTGFTSGGLFAQAPQGASGSSGGQQDFSSLTSSLEAFNTGFSASVKELASIPKTFEHNITMPTMSITLNGAEFIAKLPEAMKEAILEQIAKETPTIIQKATAEITGGGLRAFVAGGKNSTRPAKP